MINSHKFVTSIGVRALYVRCGGKEWKTLQLTHARTTTTATRTYWWPERSCSQRVCSVCVQQLFSMRCVFFFVSNEGVGVGGIWAHVQVKVKLVCGLWFWWKWTFILYICLSVVAIGGANTCGSITCDGYKSWLLYFCTLRFCFFFFMWISYMCIDIRISWIESHKRICVFGICVGGWSIGWWCVWWGRNLAYTCFSCPGDFYCSISVKHI